VNPTQPRGRAAIARDFAVAAVPWAIARVLVVASLELSRHVFDEVGRGPRPVQLGQGLFAWDAAYYRAIAEHGYGDLPNAALRFFPLVPLMSRALGFAFLGNEAVALIVIANLSALVFAALLHRLALIETGDALLARRAAWYAALFPAASTLVLGYADATALALAVGMFLALRSRRFVTAGVLGYFAALARPLGVLLVVPALVEAARELRGQPAGAWVRRIAAVAGPPLGLFTFLAWVDHSRGDAFLPFSVQKRESLRGDFVDPVSRLVDAFSDLVHGDRFGSGLHFVWAIVFLALLVVVWRRLPGSYTAFTGVTLLVALSAENLDSFERYALGAFPLLLALAIVTRRDVVERAVLTLAAGALVGYSVLAFFGVSVP
jgi:Gpi18-like mannosyltransferase